MENLAWYILDAMLIIALIGLAWLTLTNHNLRQAIIFFIAFGLLLALVWFRLAAPDVALAEAAIGAGLSGALFLTSLSQQKQTNKKDDPLKTTSTKFFDSFQNQFLNLLFVILALVFSAAFVFALMEADPDRLSPTVLMNLEQTGVSNPVTGVLLDFRAYDTMLELAVLLSAALGIMALGPVKTHYYPSGDMLSSLSQWLVPILILFSGYILWAGAHSPGGAFQAGALLAAAGVVLNLTGDRQVKLPNYWLLRGLTIGGIAGFLIIGLLLMLSGRAFLDFPSQWSGTLILFIESFATLSISIILLIAFQSGEPQEWEHESKKLALKNTAGKTKIKGKTLC